MIEDIAKITEARGIQPGSPGVDVIVWVAKDVPHAVYLDETYAFRVSISPFTSDTYTTDTVINRSS